MRNLVFLMAWLLAACTAKEKPAQKKSIELHEQALAIGKAVEQKLAAFTTSDSILLDSIELLKADLELWESNLIEVPGHDHDHHGHDHNHDHGSQPDLTPEMMLEVQTALKIEVEKLNSRIEKLLNNQDEP